MEEALQYGTTKENFYNTFKKQEKYPKKEVIKWVKKNIINARFNSVAVMWIRAYILIELNNNSRPIKKTKSDIKEEKEFGKDVYININDHFGDSGNNTIGDVLYVEDDTVSEQERVESKMVFKDGLAKLLDGIKVRDRRILMQKFGIGYPRPMTPKEISQIENLSIARISQIVMTSIEKMKKNQEKWNVDPQIMYQAVEKLY
jgi:RNA polymerase sigma factor (sigma-70 family)